MLANGKTKDLADLPAVDYMRSPWAAESVNLFACKKRVDWGLGEDPTGQDDETFMQVIKEIESKILKLKTGTAIITQAPLINWGKNRDDEPK